MIMNRLEKTSRKYSMKINVEKTKVMTIARGEKELITIHLNEKK